ncbi:MAG: ribonuclease E/G [Lachnospiraceae bacterium]|nr:ribonuclease E/G [Lachnospiraceae bacterium]
MRKVIVTKTKDSLIAAEEENGRISGLFLENSELVSLVGRIYVGRVSHIMKNIEAAFVEIGQGTICYFPLEDWRKYPSSGMEGRQLHEGDELLIQVEKDAVKTKAPVATTFLTFTGQYLVLRVGKTGIFFSSRLKDINRKESLKEFLSKNAEASFPFSFIVRTNAASASDEAIFAELQFLLSEAAHILSVWKTRTANTLLYEPEPAFLTEIFNNRIESLDEVVTDDPAAYRLIEEKKSVFMEQNEGYSLPVLRFYKDEYPLFKLYSLETVLARALSEKVWLKSGGFLVIQPTEALVSIDVNTGKFDGRKKLEDTFFKINLEAAKEIALQLKLRNLSGIIIIDFIDMAEELHRQKLLETLSEALEKDPVKTTVYGFTKLNLVEMTRKKIRTPLHELLSKTEWKYT